MSDQRVAWDFCNLIQKALSTPGSITMPEYLMQIATWKIAGLYVDAVLTDFFIALCLLAGAPR